MKNTVNNQDEGFVVSGNQAALFHAINDVIYQAMGDDVGNAHQVIAFALEHMGYNSRICQTSGGLIGLLVENPKDEGLSEHGAEINHAIVIACCIGTMATLRLAEFKINSEVDAGVIKH